MTSYVVGWCLLYIIFIFARNPPEMCLSLFEFILWRFYTYGGTDLQKIFYACCLGLFMKTRKIESKSVHEFFCLMLGYSAYSV